MSSDSKMFKTYFNDSWLINEEYSAWIKKCDDEQAFYCNWCCKKIMLSNMGEKSVRNHMSRDCHKNASKRVKNTRSISSFFSSSSQASSSKSSTIAMTTDAVCAEIIWALTVAHKNFSANSCEGISKTFKAMFADSKVCRQFSMGAQKCSYVINFGLGPFFQKKLVELVKKSPFFSISFDESLNEVLKKQQMDFVVSYWDCSKQRSCVQYFTSKFPKYCSADDLNLCLNEAIKELDQSKMIQLSMDGPHVNWSLYESISSTRKERGLPALINIGSCSLHIFHGAFQFGCTQTKWQIKQLLKNLHSLFFNAPSRRSDYIAKTKSTKFPLKFCSHRWIESQRVADRAIDIWPYVQVIVEHWKTRVPSKQPQGNNFKVIASAIEDPLITVKLKFFSYIASVLKPYLTKYQSNDPLVPIMAVHSLDIIKTLMRIVYKTGHVSSIMNIKQLKKFNFNDNNAKKRTIFFGCSGQFELDQLKKTDQVGEKDFLEINESARKFVICIIEKLRSRLLVGSSFLYKTASLNPSMLSTLGKDAVFLRFQHLVQQLSQQKIIECQVGDKSLVEFHQLISKQANVDMFNKYNSCTQRLDSFFFNELNVQQYDSLSLVIKAILVLFHGQSQVERGFSVNKALMNDNMQEKTILARRSVKAYLETNKLEPHEVKITKDLKNSVLFAREHYRAWLEEKKREDIVNKRQEKEEGDVKKRELQDLQNKREKAKRQLASLDKEIGLLTKIKKVSK